ncbi:hypothetical protein ABZ905_32195 [Streptomyces parvus]|uniref:hypothetical protein n=1 Tax=Streptomyces parvus TaxID=66428 RepID=UPI00340E9D07
MSVTLAKAANAPDATPLYLTITQDSDGKISTVTVADLPPLDDDTLMDSSRNTVWATPLPDYEGDPANAIKVLDLALSHTYRDNDGHVWSIGERAAHTFYETRSTERATLRTIEAHILRAGHLDVHTGPVRLHGYGLTLTNGEEFYVFRNGPTDPWEIAMKTWDDCYGWTTPTEIARATASPRAVAAAILAHVYDGTETRGELRPVTRAHVAYLQWRTVPHWKNLKYRARERFNRYRRRITVRIPR